MKMFSASQILGVWERAVGEHPVDRALTMLAAACPESGRDQLAELSIGRRDARLLSLRESVFGTALNASATCPHCCQSLEFTLQTTELSRGVAEDLAEPCEITDRGALVKCRLPNSVDLRAAARCLDVAEARKVLLDRCLIGTNEEALTEAAIASLADRLCECDPFADFTLELQCVECGYSWSVIFDIAIFFWSEIDALAKRLMLEVVALARAYRWSEGEILSMGATRRQFYLEMAG